MNLVSEPGADLPDLETVLGVRPDAHYRRGEIPTGGVRPSPREAWFLKEAQTVDEGDDFAAVAERCLVRLLVRLQKLEIGRKLTAEGLLSRASISIYGFCDDLRDANLHYSPEALKMLSELGVPLDEDFYQLPRGCSEP